MANRADDLLSTIVDALRNNEDVESVWLAGSRGRGTADEFSDIDIWIALHDDAIAPVVEDPLAFVHGIVPTVMHIDALSIAPHGGAFVGSWVPVDDEFEQVDWYIAPASSASRSTDTVIVFGDAPIRETRELIELPADYLHEKAQHQLALAMQMISNMVKHARRGDFWRTADHARHTDGCLIKTRSFLTSGEEPDFLTAKDSYLSEPPPTTVGEVQDLALTLLDTVAELALQANADLDDAITAMRSTVHNWRETGWKPTEEYYRALPRRYVGAGMLITDAEDNVLLLETTYKEFHEVPGGVVESGESPRAAAYREVHEELGVNIEPGRMLVFDSRSQPAPKGDAVMLIYDGGVINDPSILQQDGEEIANVRFVPGNRIEQFCTPQMAIRLRAALIARKSGRTIEITDGKVLD